jgi:hypothetical protein
VNTDASFQELAEALIDYCNAEEASHVKLKMLIQKVLGDTTPSAKLPFDASKIHWQDRENEKGKFQMSEDYNNPEHKALLEFLTEHANGCISSEGWFYWVYMNGSAIGRKMQKKRGASP